ncbi:MAG TPA: PDZ domain-containing protein, partial [Terriglobales bacterium]
MTKDTQVRTSAVVLALCTIAVIVFAWINLQKEADYPMPYDGVWWLEKGGSLAAERVQAAGPGDRAGIKPGDKLLAINDQPVRTTAALTKNLYRAGIWSKATYTLQRNGIQLEVPLITVPVDRSLN